MKDAAPSGDEPAAEQPLPPQHRHRPVLKPLGILLALAAVATLAYFGYAFLKQMGPPERCWEIKEVGGYLYKSNPCTGQFLLLGDAPARENGQGR